MNNPFKIIIAGIGTDVGKTIVASIFVKALKAHYWKPVQSGNLDKSDSSVVQSLVSDEALVCYPESYALQQPLSPHHAARLEGISLSSERIKLPAASHPLIIECAGGLLVPLTEDTLQLDLFSQWKCSWILVSKHYLGSINHTILSIEALRSRKVHFMGIVFNGERNDDSEGVILKHARVPLIGRLAPEKNMLPETINHYVKQWNIHQQVLNFLN